MTPLLALLLACARPECAQPHYDQPECRVAAEHEYARITTADGVEVAFLDARTEAPAAAGLLVTDGDGGVRGRVAGLGDFALSLTTDAPAPLSLRLDNVDPRIPPLEGEVARAGLTRTLSLDLDAGTTLLTGTLPEELCAGPVHLVAGGDIQDNPGQLRRIVAALHDEADRAEARDEPLLGLLVLGDLAEHSTADELREVRDILALSPVPVATTPGNHDVYDSRDAVYNRTFGPGNHAFTACGVRVVLLDTGSGVLADSVRGRLPELMTDPEAEHLIAGMHHPPDPGASSAGWSDEAQARHLLVELADRGAEVALAGHLHRRMRIERGDVPVVIAGTLGADQAAVDPDYGYLRLRFADRAVNPCFVSVPVPGSPGVDRFQPEACAD